MAYLRFSILIFNVLTYFFANPSSAFAETESQVILESSYKIKVAHKELVNSHSNYPDSTLSPEAISAIENLKQSLEKLVIAFVHKLPVDISLNTQKVELDLNDLVNLGATDSKTTPNTVKPKNPDIFFKAGLKKGNLLHIRNTFSIPCGNDSMLLVFQQNGDNWKHALTWKSSRYSEIHGSINSFEYSISAPDNNGEWYIVGTDSPARCSSCWGTQRFYVIEPNGQNLHPNTIFKKSETSYQCDKGPTLAITNEGFEISFLGRSIDADTLIRTHVHNYSLRNNEFTRIQPVAKSPRDFVDEWINTEWQEASQWSADSKNIKRLHVQLREQKNSYFGTIQSKKVGMQTTTQVKLWNNPDSEKDQSWNFVVQNDNENNYKLTKINEGD